MPSTTSLADIMEDIGDQDGDGEVQLGEVIAKLESRGFGPVLMVPAMIAILPTGALPTVPSLCGVSIFLLAIQMAWGRTHPWLPTRLREQKIPAESLEKGIAYLLPYCRTLDAYFRPRLSFLTNPPASRVVALVSAFLGLSMIPLELIPWACTAPALAVMVAAVGLSTRDGAVLLFGGGLGMGSFGLLYWLVA